jgi:hypothetical protein
MKATCIWQMATKSGTMVLNKNIILDFFNGVFVRFSTRGVQKHHNQLFGGSPCQKLFAKKVKEKISCRSPPSIFLSRFWPFLRMRQEAGAQKKSQKPQLKKKEVGAVAMAPTCSPPRSPPPPLPHSP